MGISLLSKKKGNEQKWKNRKELRLRPLAMNQGEDSSLLARCGEAFVSAECSVSALLPV